MSELCRHEPGPVSRLCDRCDALIVAGTYLTGACGHARLFPPGWTWAPRSWCGRCERFMPAGQPPPVSRLLRRPPSDYVCPSFWAPTFQTTETRPLSLRPLGVLLGEPTARQFCDRVGLRWPRSLYRWRSYGLTWELADTLAINSCLHPLEVWGDDWARA